MEIKEPDVVHCQKRNDEAPPRFTVPVPSPASFEMGWSMAGAPACECGAEHCIRWPATCDGA